MNDLSPLPSLTHTLSHNSPIFIMCLNNGAKIFSFFSFLSKSNVCPRCWAHSCITFKATLWAQYHVRKKEKSAAKGEREKEKDLLCVYVTQTANCAHTHTPLHTTTCTPIGSLNGKNQCECIPGLTPDSVVLGVRCGLGSAGKKQKRRKICVLFAIRRTKVVHSYTPIYEKNFLITQWRKEQRMH